MSRRLLRWIIAIFALTVIAVGVSFLLINVGGGHGIETITTITRTTTP